MCWPNREEHLDSELGRKQGKREGNTDDDRIFFCLCAFDRVNPIHLSFGDVFPVWEQFV